MRLTSTMPYLRVKARVLTAVVAFIDGFDRHVVERTINALPTSAAWSSLSNVLMNTSLDLMGLASRVEYKVIRALHQHLKLERLELDIELAKAHKQYLDTLADAPADGYADEEFLADLLFDDAVDSYAAGVEALSLRHAALDAKYGITIS